MPRPRFLCSRDHHAHHPETPGRVRLEHDAGLAFGPSTPFLIHFSTVSGLTKHNRAALLVVGNRLDMTLRFSSPRGLLDSAAQKSVSALRGFRRRRTG